jgi:hypothetical protein
MVMAGTGMAAASWNPTPEQREGLRKMQTDHDYPAIVKAYADFMLGYHKILDVAGKGILSWYTLADRVCMSKGYTPPPDGVDASVGYPLQTADAHPAASLYYLAPWFVNRSYAGFALLLQDRYDRCEEKHKPIYRRAVLETADIYMTIEPEVQFLICPDDIADVVRLLRSCYSLTKNPMYLHRADHMMKLGVGLFFDDASPLPKMSNFDHWYESSTKNGSSVEILRQMLELSLDLAALPAEERGAPEVTVETTWTAPEAPVVGNLSAGEFASAFNNAAGSGLTGSWACGNLKRPTKDVVLRYGPGRSRNLYLSQQAGEFTAIAVTGQSWDIGLSDVINTIPTAAQADKLNGKMQKFTGKGFTEDSIEDAGFKDVARQVAVVIRNEGEAPALVRATATLHDTYHDNGSETCAQRLAPGVQGMFLLTAPPRKWIRRIDIAGASGPARLRFVQLAFVMVPRDRIEPEKRR